MACTIDCDKCNYAYGVKLLFSANVKNFKRRTNKLQKLLIICNIEREKMKLRKIYNIE